DVRQPQIAQHHVEALLGNELRRLPAIGGRIHVRTLGAKEERENLADVLGIFDHEDAKAPEPHGNPCGGHTLQGGCQRPRHPWRLATAQDCYTDRTLDALGASLIEGLEDAVVVTDGALSVVAWNAVMERLTGVGRSAALGRPAADVLDFLRDADVAAHLSRAVAGGPA